MDLIDNPQLHHILAFINQHEQEDPAHLLLSKKIPESFPKKEIAEQIAARNKAKQKLPKLYFNKNVIFPPAISMEQCSSEATAVFKSTLINGETLVDLTGGFGIDTLYLSNHFKKVEYVEQQSILCKIAQHNFKALAALNVNIHHTDGLVFLKKLNHADCIYVDPARRDENNQKVYGLKDCQPDLTTLIPEMLSKAQAVLAKGAPMLDITQAIRDLKNKVEQVYIVEWKGEVRELLFKITRREVTDPIISAILLTDSGELASQFSASYLEEKIYKSTIGPAKKYLYEPSAAVMKSGLFKKLAHQFKLNKLHQNTQLFTADTIKEQFPGKIYEVTAIIAAQKKILKEHLPLLKANLKSRNFPMPIHQLKKKLSIKDGGDKFIFATTFADSSKGLLICKKLN